MICGACGEKSASSVRSIVSEGGIVDVGCDRCQGVSPSVPDVYFRQPYHSDTLDVDFTSKGQKAAYLKAHNISEAGERPMSTTSWIEGTRAWRKAQFEKERPVIRKIYKEWRERASR